MLLDRIGCIGRFDFPAATGAGVSGKARCFPILGGHTRNGFGSGDGSGGGTGGTGSGSGRGRDGWGSGWMISSCVVPSSYVASRPGSTRSSCCLDTCASSRRARGQIVEPVGQTVPEERGAQTPLTRGIRAGRATRTPRESAVTWAGVVPVSEGHPEKRYLWLALDDPVAQDNSRVAVTTIELIPYCPECVSREFGLPI